CALTTRAAAAAEAFVTGETPRGARYPVIHWEAGLWTVGTQGATLTCSRHALGGADGAVATAYTPLDAPTCFAHELAAGPGGDHTVTSVTCP
ncbi:MAG: hypothetical protein Q8M74_02055, partial [Chloroflexota bacterium]|nr:hypothetical protein [Chloroflexota bacterium]